MPAETEAYLRWKELELDLVDQLLEYERHIKTQRTRIKRTKMKG